MKLAQKLFREFISAYVENFPLTSNNHADALTTLVSAMESENKRAIEVKFLPIPDVEADLVFVGWTQ